VIPSLPGGGVPLTSTGITLQDGERARVLVAGAIGLEYNQSYSLACGIADSPPTPPYNWGPFCPGGAPYSGMGVSPRGLAALDDAFWVRLTITRPNGQVVSIPYAVSGDILRPEITGSDSIFQWYAE
jgi:hypothetical protein